MTNDKLRTSPAVSIITAVFNGEKYISETIAAIGRQTFTDFEYLIVDDCSTDKTSEIIAAAAKKDSRIRLLSMGENSGGPASPRNLGVKKAGARWIAFCDADDIWLPEKLGIQYAMAKETGAALCCTGIKNFKDGEEPEYPSSPNKPITWNEISLSKMLVKNWIALSTVLVQSEVLRSVEPFNADPEFVAVEDYDMWIRLMEATGKSALRIDQPLVLYRVVATSISAGKSKMLKKAMGVQLKHFERMNHGAWFHLTSPFRMVRYIMASIWMRQVRGKL